MVPALDDRGDHEDIDLASRFHCVTAAHTTTELMHMHNLKPSGIIHCIAARTPRAQARYGGVALLGAALSFAACSDDAEPPQASLRGESLLLVHGAWNGAWVWEDVEALLEAQGATVRTVTLPGHAEDTTPVTETSLAIYVDAVQDDEARHRAAERALPGASERRPERVGLAPPP